MMVGLGERAEDELEQLRSVRQECRRNKSGLIPRRCEERLRDSREFIRLYKQRFPGSSRMQIAQKLTCPGSSVEETADMLVGPSVVVLLEIRGSAVLAYG